MLAAAILAHCKLTGWLQVAMHAGGKRHMVLLYSVQTGVQLLNHLQAAAIALSMCSSIPEP